MNHGNVNQMANSNPYNLPPLLPPPGPNSSGAVPPNHNMYFNPQQQQQQSERLSGDGEEVHQYGYMPTGIPSSVGMAPPPLGAPAAPLLMGPPPPPSSAAIPQLPQQNSGPPIMNWGGYDTNYSNQIAPQNPFDYQMPAFQQMGPPPPSAPPIDNTEGYGGHNENRSIEGEEQQQFSSGGFSTFTDNPQDTISSNGTASLQSSHVRSETLGSDSVHQMSAFQQPMVPPAGASLDITEPYGGHNENRSIEGEEQQQFSSVGFPASSNPPEPIPISSGRGTPSLASSQARSETLGSDSTNQPSVFQQMAPPPVSAGDNAEAYGNHNENRSIEGEEQQQLRTTGYSAANNPPDSISSTGAASLPASHIRSETLGSDSVHQVSTFQPMAPPPGPAVDNTEAYAGHNENRSIEGEEQQQLRSAGSSASNNPPNPTSSAGPTSLPTSHGRSETMRRTMDSDEDRRKHRNKGRQEGNYDRDRRRYPSYDDDDSFEDDRSLRMDKRRERDREFDRRSKPPRGSRDRRTDRSRVEDWDDSVSMKETSRHYASRHYPNDQDDYRPRSRNSYYEKDDYYDRRPRRRGGEFSGYGPRDHDDYRYSRQHMPPHGYLDNSRGPYASQGRPPFVPANNTQQAQLSKLEQFRIDYPSQYAEWYRKYTAHMSNPGKYPLPSLPAQYQVASSAPRSTAASDGNQRPSSGLSSIGHDGLQPHEFMPIQEQTREPSPPKRSTPQKFLSSHSLAVLTPLGKMIRVRNGGTVVEVMNLKPLMKRAPEYKEIKSFPGPLIKDVTHKKTIITFCERKIRELESNHAQIDRDNLILLWELLILLLRQNGMAIGSDIAELLLKSKPVGGSENSRSSRGASDSDSDNNEDVQQSEGAINGVNEAKCIEKFCEKLIYGRKKEALEYAMDNGLWGHALFFASKMDQRTYGNVLARFANGMSMNSPLQTLYQILSGNQPASVTSCCDDGFGDWKPHLAMILSNSGLKPEVEGKAIAILGDTLASRNQPFAAQFCYLMAHAEFSPESKIGSLLGYIPSKNNLIEATQMTEIYEFARSLGDSEVTLGTYFLRSKLHYTETLLSLGFVQEAYLYCEEMTKALKKGKITAPEQVIAWDILRISERLTKCEDSNNSDEPGWIEELKRICDAAYGGSESSYSRKQSITTSASDRNINELPGALDQLNLNSYSDLYNPPNVNEAQDQTSNYGTTSSVSVPDSSATTNHWNQQNQGDIGYDSQTQGLLNNNAWNGGVNHQPSQPTFSNQSSFELSSSNSNVNATTQLSQPNEAMSLPYGSETPNNNYLSNPQFDSPYMSGPGLHLPSQPSNLSGGSRKKSVRFEDEEVLTGKGVDHDLETLLDNLTSRVAHEKHTLRKSKSLLSGINVNSNFSESPSDSMLHKRSASRGEYLDKFKNHSEDSSPATSPLKFKSTFPIDQPLSKSSAFKKMSGQSKLYTYPVDEKCCDSNEPCDEHDHYLSENEGNYSPVKSNIKHAPDKTDMPPRPADNIKPPVPKPSEKKINKDENKSPSKQQQQPKKGFLGSILGVLNRNKGPNQMHLPEDKQPTIVWDAQKGQWVNTAGDDEGDSGPKGPPPKDSELSGAPPPMSGGPSSLPPSQPYQNPPAPSNSNTNLHNNHNSLPPNVNLQNRQPSQMPSVMNGAIPNSMPQPTMGGQPNKYKQAKGLGIGKKYVNAWTQENSVAAVSSEPVVPLPGVGGGFGQPNIFMPVPSPVSGDGPTSFLTTSLDPHHPNEGSDSQPPAPQMFNPAQFQNHNTDYSVNR